MSKIQKIKVVKMLSFLVIATMPTPLSKKVWDELTGRNVVNRRGSKLIG
jgi:hypothetical protein